MAVGIPIGCQLTNSLPQNGGGGNEGGKYSDQAATPLITWPTNETNDCIIIDRVYATPLARRQTKHRKQTRNKHTHTHITNTSRTGK